MEKFNHSSRVNPVDIFGDVNYQKFSVGQGVIDMSSEPEDFGIYSTGFPGKYLPTFMVLIPETAGVLKVELKGADEGDVYTITAAQVDASLGKPLPYKVRKVLKTGTTSTFSVVW